jgi:hypothetical protein
MRYGLDMRLKIPTQQLRKIPFKIPKIPQMWSYPGKSSGNRTLCPLIIILAGGLPASALDYFKQQRCSLTGATATAAGGEHPDLVWLNVGGSFHMTSAETLRREPGSFFTELLADDESGLALHKKVGLLGVFLL